MTAQKDTTQNHSDFSIEHILNRAGSSTSSVNNLDLCENAATNSAMPLDPYSWLQCTRYCPPKVPRANKREGPQKRQLGRHPRIPFTSYQLSVLEEKFKQSPYLSSEEVTMLSRQLQLVDVRVKIWFQNRRARERRERQQNKNSESSTKESANVRTSPVSVVSDATVYNFFTPNTILTNNLAGFVLPVPNQIQVFENRDDR
ncbi:homeobox protein ceh-5 isoform X2 [Tribolium castaneum]|uniref:Homeobox protein MSX-1-like Protein n=1 Tax=Tribolium castaneum TaxID=7070 RepID=D6WTU3_TRICA|nr:PREDICTED: homeobox protein ceh-5 isoform X2 [Tribolium castaneum]EFA07332.1 Homeobox protein MSX-1-like Protein [Tribolium castaneum]|eukprot:XP_001807502.3 PREDICTED: homeobox protein ceh-5 isoform X2 [Tribolium castaneum]